MINKYLISKILFTFFSTSTVIIFALLYTGAFVGLVGSIEAAIMIYAVNTTLLLVSLLWYIWQKAHKDLPKRRDEEILQAFAESEVKNDIKSTAGRKDG